MERKKIVTKYILPPASFLIYMIILHFTGLCLFPKLTECRVTDRPVYIWNAHHVDYSISVNDSDADTFNVGEDVFRVRMSGFLHKSCNTIPVVDVKVTVKENGRFSVKLKNWFPKDNIIVHWVPVDGKEPPNFRLDMIVIGIDE